MTLKSPYVVFSLWHWLCCSVGPLQRCYRPAGTCNRYCCPPDPWWELKFYSPLSWSRWLCLAFASHPSTAAKTTQHNNTDYILSTVSFFFFFFLLKTSVCWHEAFQGIMPTLLHEWMNNYMDNNTKRSLHCLLAVGAVRTMCTTFAQLYDLCGYVLGWPHSLGCVCGCCSRRGASRWPLPQMPIHSSPAASRELCWALRDMQYSRDKEEDTDSLHPHLQAELLNILQLHPISSYHLVRRRKWPDRETWKNVFFHWISCHSEV